MVASEAFGGILSTRSLPSLLCPQGLWVVHIGTLSDRVIAAGDTGCYDPQTWISGGIPKVC
jgi:hypothetical protein